MVSSGTIAEGKTIITERSDISHASPKSILAWLTGQAFQLDGSDLAL